MKRHSRGVTLVELVVTIALLAILVGMGVPAFRDLIRRNLVTTQTNELLSTLQYGRSEAAKRGIPVTVTITAGEETGWSATVFSGATQLRVTDRMDKRVSLDLGGDAEVTVTFAGTGFVTAAGSFQLLAGDAVRWVCLQPSGLARVDKEGCI